ncbi:hypothetical protein [uncultured Tessaracoccus sp.]|uniref:hypothetical protein n=1 Tax=uncultured Tessaracoccus sp. TaxID=905023 RepID=UPI002619ACE4|nr:hypothetical protein [uncultured Tessaracoccus sp.]
MFAIILGAIAVTWLIGRIAIGTLNDNYRYGTSTGTGYVYSVVPLGIGVVTTLLTPTDWLYIVPIGVLGLVSVEPMVKAWACPRPVSMFGNLPRLFWPIAAGVVVLGGLLTVGTYAAFAVAAAALGTAAWRQVHTGSVQEQRLGAVASSLAAVLGIAEERILDSAPVVADDGTITIGRVHSATVARLDRIDGLVAQMMPEYEVASASANRIVLAPVSVATANARATMAETGGLIAGIDEPQPRHPSIDSDVMEGW